jgi:hypothetical protein
MSRLDTLEVVCSGGSCGRPAVAVLMRQRPGDVAEVLAVLQGREPPVIYEAFACCERHLELFRAEAGNIVERVDAAAEALGMEAQSHPAYALLMLGDPVVYS